MELIILSTLAVGIQANRLLQQFTIPVNGGCSNPPPSFSCNIDERCCDIGNGEASCCTINPIPPIPPLAPVSIPPDACNCITSLNPVCCNGNIYRNDCEARCYCTGTITNFPCFQTRLPCSSMRCGIDGKTECYDKPGTGGGTCCAPDALCTDNDYTSTVTSVCLDDETRWHYANKCFGRCDGFKACGALCLCSTDADCGSGEECLSDGICAVTGASCGGFAGVALCNDDEICISSPIAPGQQPVGNCYSLPDQCTPHCSGIDFCTSYKPDPCNTCRCGTINTSLKFCARFPSLCETEPGFVSTCNACMDGYHPSADGKTCEKNPSCGGIDKCENYTRDSCLTCQCPGPSGMEICPSMHCPNPPPELQGIRCNACIDGYRPSADGKTCEKISSCGGIDRCLIYKIDRCNFCRCDTSGRSESCVRVWIDCGDPSLFPNRCLECETGYVPNADGSACVEEAAACCEQLNGIEDVMRVCGFEGCQCCPDGTWSGSIGDGRTFCVGLILGQDKFGTVCGIDVETKKICNIESDCNRAEGFRCRRDPVCMVNSDIVCENSDKVCVDYSLNNYCSFDYECDTWNGYKCLTGNNVEGYCVKYEANVV